MNNRGNQPSRGIVFGELLFIVFLVLKLTKVISWSWWWITAPLWIPFLIVVVSAVILYFKIKDS